MTRRFYTYFWMLPLLALTCFCTKQDEENQLTRQEKNIDAFINQQKKDTVIYRGAASRVVLERGRGEGDTLAAGDWVHFYYYAYIFPPSAATLYSSNIPDIQSSWPLSEAPEDFGENEVGVGRYIPGLDAGLIGMRLEEHALIICTSKYGYGNRQMGVVPKMSPLLFEVWVDRIVKKK